MGSVIAQVIKRTDPSQSIKKNKEMQSKFFSLFYLVVATIFLSGCVAGLLAGQAARVGYGSYKALDPENNIDLKLDQMETMRLQSQLDGVNHIAILAKSEIAQSFADRWEAGGKHASIITGYKDSGSLSRGKVKAALVRACKRSVDAAIYGRVNEKDTNHWGILAGKGATTIGADLFVYSCRRKKLDMWPVTMVSYAMKPTDNELDHSVGAGIAAKFIEISI